MPGVNIGAILGAVGQMFLQSLMNALTNTLTQLLTNAITGALHSIAEAVGDLGTGLKWVRDAVDTFADNLSAELTSTVSRLTNSVNLYAQSTLQVIDAQKNLHDQLVKVEEATLDYLFQKQRQEEERHREVGAAVTAFLLKFVAGRREQMEQFVREYKSRILNIPAEEVNIVGSWTAEFYEIMADYVLEDLKFVESLGSTELQAAERSVVAIVEQRREEFLNWFTEIVVKPITYHNAMFQAMQKVYHIDPDEFIEQIKTLEEITADYYEQKAHELAKEIGEE